MFSFDSLAMFESPWQILIVLVIVLVLFGGGRIKEIMGGLGSGVKEFKKGLSDDDEKPAAATNVAVNAAAPTEPAAKKE